MAANNDPQGLGEMSGQPIEADIIDPEYDRLELLFAAPWLRKLLPPRYQDDIYHPGKILKPLHSTCIPLAIVA